MLFCPQRSGVKTRPCLQAPYILCTFYFLLHHESRHGWKALCEVRTPGPGEGGVRQELWGVVHTHTHTSPTLRASPSPSPADSTDLSPGPWSALWSLCLSVTSQGALLGLSLLSFKPSQGPLRSPQFLDFPIRGSSPCHFKPPHLWVPLPGESPSGAPARSLDLKTAFPRKSPPIHLKNMSSGLLLAPAEMTPHAPLCDYDVPPRFTEARSESVLLRLLFQLPWH